VVNGLGIEEKIRKRIFSLDWISKGGIQVRDIITDHSPRQHATTGSSAKPETGWTGVSLPMRGDHSRGGKNGRGYWLAGAGAVLFILGGLFTWWTVQRTDRELREVLLLQTRLVARALNVEHVQALSGNVTDLGNPNYQRLKEQLAIIKEGSDRCRFVYLLGRRGDGQVFFLVDNEPPNSKDYSPPGQVYGEASQAIHQVFVSGVEAVTGSMKDRWGVWVTALVPLE